MKYNNLARYIPAVQCMVYLPTFTPKPTQRIATLVGMCLFRFSKHRTSSKSKIGICHSLILGILASTKRKPPISLNQSATEDPSKFTALFGRTSASVSRVSQGALHKPYLGVPLEVRINGWDQWVITYL